MKKTIKESKRRIETFMCLQCSSIFNSDEYRKEFIEDDTRYWDFSRICFHDICPNCKNQVRKYRKMIALDRKELYFDFTS